MRWLTMKNADGQSIVSTARPVVLVGQFEHALDSKKRLTVPACWREQIGTYVYVFPNPHDACLFLIPPAEMESRIAALNPKITDKEANALLAQIGKSMEQCVIDVQGRIRIRDGLLQYAGLTDGVVMIGASRKVELWPAAERRGDEAVDRAALIAACEALAF
jgi:MraZ protein